MADTKTQEDPTLSAKRKPDLLHEDEEVNGNKIQELQTLNGNTSPAAKENSENGDACEKNNHTLKKSTASEAKIDPREPESVAEPEEEEDEEDYEEEEDDDEDGEDSNGEAVVDRKGKGILRDDKGKGKLIEEDSDDDSDSEDDSHFGESEAESDLSDDPLAEVDLDNILPSRTRRRAEQPGLRIANDRRNAQDDDSNA